MKITETQEFKSETKSAVAGREFLNWWKWESIGAACEPKCGGCRCGSSQPGGNLKSEREALHTGTQNIHGLKTQFLYIKATFLRTDKQVRNEPEWQAPSTVHEMVEREAAKTLTREIITRWEGQMWYKSHLVAPNPHSVATHEEEV